MTKHKGRALYLPALCLKQEAASQHAKGVSFPNAAASLRSPCQLLLRRCNDEGLPDSVWLGQLMIATLMGVHGELQALCALLSAVLGCSAA
jgi:hypothetical protein